MSLAAEALDLRAEHVALVAQLVLALQAREGLDALRALEPPPGSGTAAEEVPSAP